MMSVLCSIKVLYQVWYDLSPSSYVWFMCLIMISGRQFHGVWIGWVNSVWNHQYIGTRSSLDFHIEIELINMISDDSKNNFWWFYWQSLVMQMIINCQDKSDTTLMETCYIPCLDEPSMKALKVYHIFKYRCLFYANI